MKATILLAGFATLAIPVCAIAQDHHATVQPDALKWSAPAVYSPGAQTRRGQGRSNKRGHVRCSSESAGRISKSRPTIIPMMRM